MKVTDGFIREIELAPLPEDYGCDCAQAFGSQYYSDGSDVIIAVSGWTKADYAFPLDGQILKTVE